MNRSRIADHLSRVLLHTAFDPDQFSQMPIEGANDTVVIPPDEGEYPAIIDKYEFRTIEKTGQLVMDVTWSIDDAGQKEKTGREKLTVRQGIFIDRLPNGSLDMGTGKNVALGRLREALGMNVPGQAFMFSMLPGQAARVRTKNRKDGDDVFTDVKGVTRL